jgi:hypothetical protein
MPGPDQIEWWLKTGSIYGLGFVLLAGLCFLALYGSFKATVLILGIIGDAKKWIPKAVGAYLGFVEHVKSSNSQVAEASAQVATANTQVAEAVKAMTESHSISSDNHGRTHRALAYVAEAAKPDTTNQKAIELLDKALRELRQ